MARRALRRVTLFFVALVLVAGLWELYKLVGPDDGGSVVGLEIIPKANDRAMPHVWTIISRMFEPESTALDEPIIVTVLGYGWYTFRIALVGLVLGVGTGLGLAIVMARFDIAERAILPWVVASQTVPLIALAPQVVSWSGRFTVGEFELPRWVAVSLLAAFLAFFPVAVGALRGLKATPAAALELMESYAATWPKTLWKVRLPYAVPYIIPALKLAATLSVVGVIVAEVSTGIRGGIGRAVLSYAQSRTGDPAKLYSAVVVSAIVGMAMFGLVVALDILLTANRPPQDS